MEDLHRGRLPGCRGAAASVGGALCRCLDLAAVGDHDVLRRVPPSGAQCLHRLHHTVPVRHLPVHTVLPIEPGSLGSAQKELRAVGVGPRVRHGEHTRAGMGESKVLIGEGAPVDAVSTGTVVVGEVASLAHETGNNTVKTRALVALHLAVRSAHLAEVLGRLWANVGLQLHSDAPKLRTLAVTPERNVEEHDGVCRIDRSQGRQESCDWRVGDLHDICCGFASSTTHVSLRFFLVTN
mmetsp:Transcript_5591/g.9649  ORF Transcript_5591/g.9649 Transcript_5591/m.9649 type:complete len:238 (+) Transcript_5591:439-1152(+)